MEIKHARLLTELSSSDLSKRITALSTVIQLAAAGQDVCLFLPTVLQKALQNPKSNAVARRLAYDILVNSPLTVAHRDTLGKSIQAHLKGEEVETQWAALRALASLGDIHLRALLPRLQPEFGTCLQNRSSKVRECALQVVLSHIRALANPKVAVAQYYETVKKSIVDTTAEVTEAALAAFRELMSPVYPPYFYQEGLQPTYSVEAAHAFSGDHVWLSKLLSRLPLFCRISALRPVTLLHLHLATHPRGGAGEPTHCA
eukprot:RCo028999